jgi:hypothetical protein
MFFTGGKGGNGDLDVTAYPFQCVPLNAPLNAFSDCRALETVKLPEGLVLIADHAFSSCMKLGGGTIPVTVKTIGKMAFYDSPDVQLTSE